MLVAAILSSHTFPPNEANDLPHASTALTKGMSPCYPPDRGLDGPQSQSRRSEKKIISYPARNRIPTPRPPCLLHITILTELSASERKNDKVEIACSDRMFAPSLTKIRQLVQILLRDIRTGGQIYRDMHKPIFIVMWGKLVNHRCYV
jgi:hypothetical protein